MDARARLRELSDFAAPWAVWIAATLRLPDRIREGATTAEELAARAGADSDALRRLMRYLVARGLFAEVEDRYENTELSALLLEEAGWRRWVDLDGAPGLWAGSWARLLGAVRAGSPGTDETGYYEELARRGLGAAFDELMAAQVRANAEQLAAAFDWSVVEHVVDVGGGTGTLVRTILAAHPHLRGTLFDLPQVVREVEPGDRLAVVAGDVFADAIPAGGAYVLSQILHGWPDEPAARILARCAEAGGDSLRILLLEGLLGEEPSADEAAFDLFMLTLTGGRQRSVDEFGRLAQACGLELRSVRRLDTGTSLLELGR